MNNFLLIMDGNGCIDSVIEQEGFTIQSNQYIFDIFDDSKEEVMRCIHDSEVFMQFYYFTIKDSANTIGVYMARRKEAIIVLGLDVQAYMNSHLDVSAYWMRRFIDAYSGEDYYADMQRKDEEIRQLHASLKKSEHKGPNAYIARNDNRLLERLQIDPATGLLSRYAYAFKMEEMITSNPNKKGVFTWIDLSAMKNTYSDKTYQQILHELGSRFQMLEKSDLTIRLANDAIGLFSYGWNKLDISIFDTIWNEIQEKIIHPDFYIDSHLIPFSIDAGMAIYGMQSKDVFETINVAKIAMQYAKAQGENTYMVYSDRLEDTDMYVDTLTGVKSSVAYFQYVTRINAQMKNEYKPLGLCLLHLFSTNIPDSKSAQQEIKRASIIICQTFDHSPVFRINENEFAVILEGNDYKNQTQLLRQIDRQNKVDIRYGLTLWQDGDRDFAQLMARARMDMTQKKGTK